MGKVMDKAGDFIDNKIKKQGGGRDNDNNDY